MTSLEVVNACLATMGQNPINSLNDPHPMRGAATSLLYKENRRRQAVGRWYNMEQVTLTPDTIDGKIYLPGDKISFRAPTRNTVQRGRTLYDLDNGTPIFTLPVKGTLIRLVPFDDLPESAAAWIAAEVVLKFQMSYDGDSNKTKQLAIDAATAKADENIDHIRNRKTNLIDSNVGLQRLKFFTRGARRYINP